MPSGASRRKKKKQIVTERDKKIEEERKVKEEEVAKERIRKLWQGMEHVQLDTIASSSADASATTEKDEKKTPVVTTAAPQKRADEPIVDYVFRFDRPIKHTPPDIVKYFLDNPVRNITMELKALEKKLKIKIPAQSEHEIQAIMAARHYVMRQSKDGYAILGLKSLGITLLIRFDCIICAGCFSPVTLEDIIQCKGCGMRSKCLDCRKKIGNPKNINRVHNPAICELEQKMVQQEVVDFIKGGFRRCMYGRCNKPISQCNADDIVLCYSCKINMYCCEKHRELDSGSDMEPGPHQTECVAHQKQLANALNPSTATADDSA